MLTYFRKFGKVERKNLQTKFYGWKTLSENSKSFSMKTFFNFQYISTFQVQQTQKDRSLNIKNLYDSNL